MNTRRGRENPGLVALLERVLADLPNLPAAACRGQHDTFDAAAAGDTDAMRTADWICRHCPERAQCPEARADQ